MWRAWRFIRHASGSNETMTYASMTAVQSRLLNVLLLSAAVGLVLAVGWPAEDPLFSPASTGQLLGPLPSPVSSPVAIPRSNSSPSGHPDHLRSHSISRHSERSGRAVEIAAARLDLNQATTEQLQELPGIGETIARRVVHRREAHGAYRSVDDLLEVKGIGRKRLEQLRNRLIVGRQPKSPARGTSFVPSEREAM